MLARDSTSGPADVRIATTKPGWYRLLRSGLTSCESDRLIALDSESGVSLERASKNLLREARSQKASFGWIAIDGNGNVEAEKTTETLIWGSMGPGGLEIFKT